MLKEGINIGKEIDWDAPDFLAKDWYARKAEEGRIPRSKPASHKPTSGIESKESPKFIRIRTSSGVVIYPTPAYLQGYSLGVRKIQYYGGGRQIDLQNVFISHHGQLGLFEESQIPPARSFKNSFFESLFEGLRAFARAFKQGAALPTEAIKEIAAQALPQKTRADKKELFYEYLNKWRVETSLKSNPRDIILNTNYQLIIGLGEEILPVLLEEIKTKPTNLFHALKMISRADPTTNEDRKDILKMVDSWLTWGRNQGLIK
jgi:hypothetical protein